ncbi:drug/metabolite transporter (DMT)-like permease [Pseudochelatococcus lubricantis]|uniref:Drug/metabolite transporter (DMT)-like permease n=1 Tax=Pseudochelatococcus lubricantis TaxID=1538102 RepID=A0ABX0UUV3_9HYPH|nr:DMT family transporter [Pseudochelatococcus lubricantis]NIJ56547.1 drug/metabolite transporter (DMT)-like permease [Pseudochelatococcus lubricantis]
MSPALARAVPAFFVVIWATGFIVARLVAPHADPMTFLALRCALAAAVFILIALAVGARWPTTPRHWFNAFVAGVLMQGCYLGATFWATKRGLPAGIVALIMGLQPLLTGILSVPLLGERVSGQRWFGIVLGFAGALLVLFPRIGEASALPPAAMLVALAGMVSMTLGTVWQKRTAASSDLRTNAAVQFIGGVAFLLPLALLTEDLRLDGTTEMWIGLVWAVLGLSVGAITLLLFLIRQGAVAGVAALLYLVPPVSALMAFFLFGETLETVQIAGMAISAVGVAIANRP